jgi:hypothetical protein
LAKSARSVNTIVPPTVTLRASIVLENHSGSGEGMPSAIPMAPEARNTTTNAANQRTPDRTPLNTSAPSGAITPQIPTPPVGRKPPVGSIDSVGARAMAASWMRSSRSKSRVRANRRIEPIEIAAYRRAMFPTHVPIAVYRTHHTSAIGRISTAMRTRRPFRSRVSSSSSGSAPTAGSRTRARSNTRRREVTRRG